MKRLPILLYIVVACFAATSFIACENDTPKEEVTPGKDDGNEDEGKEDDENTQNPEYTFDNYIAFNGVATELKSMCYIINDTGDMGIQYAMAMTNADGVTSFDDIIEEDEYVFLSLSEEVLFDAIESTDGCINAMNIDSEDVVYMFVAKMGELDIMDTASNHLNIISGEVVISLDEQTREITIKAQYDTVLGDVEFAATLPHYEEEPVVTDTFFRYTWGDVSVDSPVGSAYAEETIDGVIYTICKDAVKTYVYYEDTPFLKVEIAGKTMDDNFTIDVATYEGEFSIWACDPIKGMDLRVSNDNRTNRTGIIEVKDGALCCKNLSYNDITVNVNFNETYRTVNECVNISYNERAELFTPRSVVLDNSGENENKIYVSSRAGITTVKDMVNPDVVVTYPKEGWEKWLMKGNFISGSSYPDMTFKYKKSTYKKGEGVCYGMNAQIPEYDAESGRLRLNLNLYTEEGGMALYYSGEFTLIEE